jgi:competence protein ComEA
MGRRCRLPLAVLLLLLVAVVAVAQKKPPAQPVNINTASAEELTTLPGIGPATARAIVQYREKHGPFRRVEELLIIRGISRARLRAIRPYVRVK